MSERDFILKELKWQPKGITEFGCIEGGLRYLGSDITDVQIYGGLGYAFFPFIPGECGDDPAYGIHEEFRTLGKNIGFVIDSFKEGEYQDKITKALHQNKPCLFFGWNQGEYVLVKGYNDEGVYISYYGSDEEFISWNDVTPGYSLELCEKAPDAVILKESLKIALKFKELAKSLRDFNTYEAWNKTIAEGTVHAWGITYDIFRIKEARSFAHLFLRSVASKLTGTITEKLTESAEIYETIYGYWSELEQLFPIWVSNEDKQKNITDSERIAKCSVILDKLIMSEEKGTGTLREIVQMIP